MTKAELVALAAHQKASMNTAGQPFRALDMAQAREPTAEQLRAQQEASMNTGGLLTEADGLQLWRQGDQLRAQQMAQATTPLSWDLRGAGTGASVKDVTLHAVGLRSRRGRVVRCRLRPEPYP